MTFSDRYTLEVGGERVELAWHGPNHSPDNIYIHFPDHDTLMFIDVVNAGWIPIYNLNLSDDVIGYTGAPAIALDSPWTHLISGHLGRVATREDVAMHQQYIADIEASSREALASVNPGPLFGHYGENVWAGVSAYLERARRELLATGETVRKRTAEALTDLTAQEAEVAKLARDGHSNQEIAAQLFISPRTVEWHLGNVFTKLGITSRKDLR